MFLTICDTIRDRSLIFIEWKCFTTKLLLDWKTFDKNSRNLWKLTLFRPNMSLYETKFHIREQPQVSTIWRTTVHMVLDHNSKNNNGSSCKSVGYIQLNLPSNTHHRIGKIITLHQYELRLRVPSTMRQWSLIWMFWVLVHACRKMMFALKYQWFLVRLHHA